MFGGQHWKCRTPHTFRVYAFSRLPCAGHALPQNFVHFDCLLPLWSYHMKFITMRCDSTTPTRNYISFWNVQAPPPPSLFRARSFVRFKEFSLVNASAECACFYPYISHSGGDLFAFEIAKPMYDGSQCWCCIVSEIRCFIIKIILMHLRRRWESYVCIF